MVTVRQATEADLPGVMRLARAMRDEAPALRRLPLDGDRIASLGYRMVAEGTLVVAVDGDEPVGFMGAMVLPDVYTGVLYGSEVGLYVDPEWRREGLAAALVQVVESACARRGAWWLSAGDRTGGAGWAGGLYRGLGYATGETFIKALAPGRGAV